MANIHAKIMEKQLRTLKWRETKCLSNCNKQPRWFMRRIIQQSAEERGLLVIPIHDLLYKKIKE